MDPVLVFIGPSGSGKSTVVRTLQRRGKIAVTPSWTTRPRRRDERDATVEHRFVAEDEFDVLARAGFFLEVVELFGLPYRYGLPQVEHPGDGRVAAIMVRAPLMPLVRKHFPDHVVYQIEDASERLQDRLAARCRPASELGTRLAGAEDERRLGREIATRVFVNDTSPSVLAGAVADAIDEDFAVERSGHS